MPLMTTDYDDMVIAADRSFDKPNFIEVTDRLQQYEVMSKWMAEERLVVSEGRGLSRVLLNRIPNTARFVGLYEKDVVDVENILDQLDVDWNHANNYWLYDVREVKMLGPEKIVDLVEAKRVACMIGFAKKFETAAWTVPSASDAKTMRGVQYWICDDSINGSATQGFFGGVPTGYTLIGGINPTNEATWRNWTDTFSNYTEEDLIDKMEEAYYQIGWEPVIDSSAQTKFQQDLRIYMPRVVYKNLVTLMRKRNDQLGFDVGKGMGAVTYLNVPLIPNRQLDALYKADSTDIDIFFVDHSCFGIAILGEDYLTRSGPIQNGGSHTVREMWMDVDACASYCFDRRRQARLAKV